MDKYIKMFEKFNHMNNLKFKKWFNNSLLVDENDNPLIMYHGSPHINEIKEFKNTNGYTFFTSSIAESSRYTGQNDWKSSQNYIKSFYIKAEKIFDPSNMNSLEKSKVYEILNENSKDILNMYHDTFQDMDYRLQDMMDEEIDVSKLTDLEKCIWLLESDLDNYIILESGYLQHWITSNNYDSFITLESGGGDLNIAVYNPNQIKSTNNIGSFNLLSNNIFESK